MFGGTLCTYSFHDVVDFPGNESLGQIDVWNEVLVQAIGIMAHLTIEMAVLLIFVALAVVVADTVFMGSASVVHTVDEMMLVEEDEGTEYDRFVNAVELFFQCSQAECISLGGNGFVDK